MNNFKFISKYFKELYNSNDFIPLHAPNFSGKEKDYLLNCIDSTFVSSVGKYVDKFELELSKYIRTKRAVAVVNGTAGLQVALRLAGVKSGDEVITQALTFVATINSIIYNNASPIFIDVDLDTMGLSPKYVREFLEKHAEIRDDGCYNKKTGNRISACVPMHTFGFPVNIDELVGICHNWKIPIVEDAAESLGSEYNGILTGSFGKLGVFSFNGNKIITSGGGGVIVTNDDNLGSRAKHLTTTAKKPHEFEYFHDEIAYNYRMPNINAALACAQLEQLHTFIIKKRNLAKLHASYFKSKGIKFRTELPNTKANYWLMCVQLKNKKDRDLFLKSTNKNKVMTRPIWQLMFRLPMFKNYERDNQLNAIHLEKTIVNIPSSLI
jgi:perosamine synthetase